MNEFQKKFSWNKLDFLVQEYNDRKITISSCATCKSSFITWINPETVVLEN